MVVLDVAETLGVVDYFVIASGSSDRQVKTVIDNVEERLREDHGRKPLHREGVGEARWALLDYGDVVVHVFLDDVRRFYDLERLWSDSPKVDWD